MGQNQLAIVGICNKLISSSEIKMGTLEAVWKKMVNALRGQKPEKGAHYNKDGSWVSAKALIIFLSPDILAYISVTFDKHSVNDEWKTVLME